jgi:hypothetical protein
MVVHAVGNIISGIRAPKRFRGLDPVPTDMHAA